MFIIRFKIKQGKADGFREHYIDRIPPVVAGKPGTVAQLAYENADAPEGTVVRLFSSADAMDRHLQESDERSKRTYEFVAPRSVEILGRPNASTMEMIQENTGPGVVLRVNPHYIGGFIRSLALPASASIPE